MADPGLWGQSHTKSWALNHFASYSSLVICLSWFLVALVIRSSSVWVITVGLLIFSPDQGKSLCFLWTAFHSRAFTPRDQAIFLILATPSGVHISRALALPGRCEKMLNPNSPPPRSGRLNQICSLTRAPGDSYVPGVWGRLQYISFLPRAYLYFLRGGR